jgi:hypothetical protein
MKQLILLLWMFFLVIFFWQRANSQTNTASNRYCGCQIITINDGMHSDELAVFAERSADNNSKITFRWIETYIKKELTYLQKGFIIKIIPVAFYQIKADCTSLAENLKLKGITFKKVTVLNVDALQWVARN